MDEEALLYILKKAIIAYATTRGVKILFVNVAITMADQKEMDTSGEDETVTMDGLHQVTVFLPGDEFEPILEN